MVAAATIGAAVVGGVASSSAAKKASKASAGASDAAAQQAAIARDQWDSYKETYQPLEKQYAADAQNYDTPAQREEAAGLAATTVSDQYTKARERLARTPGLDPSSGAYAATLGSLDRAQAATDAISQNSARKQVEATGWARRTDALSLGKGLPAQASSGLATAASLQSGIASSQNANAAAIGSSAGGLASTLFNAWPSSTSTGLDTYNAKIAATNASTPGLASVSAGMAPTSDLSGISWL